MIRKYQIRYFIRVATVYIYILYIVFIYGLTRECLVSMIKVLLWNYLVFSYLCRNLDEGSIACFVNKLNNIPNQTFPLYLFFSVSHFYFFFRFLNVCFLYLDFYQFHLSLFPIRISPKRFV